MKTTPEERARLRALREAATPGQWGHEDDDNPELVTAGIADGAFQYVCDTSWERGDQVRDFIIAAGNMATDLLDDIDESERHHRAAIEAVADLRRLGDQEMSCREAADWLDAYCRAYMERS